MSLQKLKHVMKNKKKKKAVCGDKITLNLDGETIWATDGSWTNCDYEGWTISGAIYPTLTDEEYYKYLDMLYEAWKALNKAGYKVKVEME